MVVKQSLTQQRREALERLLEIATLLQRGMESDTTGRGLTVARAGVLWLVHHRGSMRQRDIADELRVTPRNVTGLLDALERTGFVTRAAHPTDRRASLIQLTPKGQAAGAALSTDQREFASFLFDGMASVEIVRLVAFADQILLRLHNRAYSDIRHIALDRWAKQQPSQTEELHP